MKCSSSACGRIARLFSIMFAASLLLGLMSSFAARAQPTHPTPPSATTQPSAEELAKRQAWRAAIARTPTPKKGCFTAVYPNTAWQEAPCSPPSRYPNPPALPKGGPGPIVGHGVGPVGNGLDYSAQPASGLISSAAGSFDSVAPATITETGPWSAGGPPPAPHPGCNHPPPCPQPDTTQTPNAVALNAVALPNAFTLQLNTKPFPTPACQGVAGCQGWQQFVFSQNQCKGPCVFIEYWLLNFGAKCPTASWTQWGNDCFINSDSSSAPAVPAAQLQDTTLTGTAAGDSDTVVLTTTSGTAMATVAESVLNLAQGWNTVEWNVFGDCCDSQASFSPGSTLVVRTSVNAGDNSLPPTCVQEGFTGETNNLLLLEAVEAAAARTSSATPVSPIPVPGSGATFPAIVFAESNAASGGKFIRCTGSAPSQ
jgi:hypothetical protein